MSCSLTKKVTSLVSLLTNPWICNIFICLIEALNILKMQFLILLMPILELRQRGFILDKSLDEINNRLEIERNGKDITCLFFFSLD